MKVKLSIRKYIGWIWIIERSRDIRKECKKLSDLSDLPDGFLPKLVFIDEKEFNDALKVCGSDTPEEGLSIVHGKDIDIEWIDDFNYQKKIDEYQEKLDLKLVSEYQDNGRIDEKVESKILKTGCPVCLQKVDTYTDGGVLKIENHNYRDSDLQCPGSGDELKSLME